jgi:carboxymethylenebutenolidase
MGSTITVTAADGHSFGAYLAGDEHATRGVVVLQEIFGVNAHMRGVVERYAANGYLAIAPQMFDRAEKGVELGYGPDDRARGIAMRAKITDAQALADLAASAAALKLPIVGVLGECWGGSLAWLGATGSTTFKAASCWYGGGIAETKDAHPNCPVQMQFGETDGSIPMSAVEAIRAAQPQAEIYVYPNAGHGFGCADRDSFDKVAFELAQARTFAFFDRYLR